jgi:phage gp29-like protein
VSKVTLKAKNRKSPPAGQTSGGGKSLAELVRKSNQFRDNYNPLRGLVISKVVSLLEAAERGDYAELQLVMRKIEKRYPVLKALKARRLAALEELDWDIKVMDPLPPGVTEAQAEKQKQFLRSRYELIKNLTDSFGQLALAEFRGYTILQKHRYTDGGANDGAVKELYWLPQWTWSRDGSFGDFYYNEKSAFGIGLGSCAGSLGETNRLGSESLPREDFVIREVESPLYEIALIAFVNWSMGRKDYAAFVEIFGLPSTIVILPPNIPAGKEDEYQSAAEKVADGVSGALPNGSDAKFPSAGVRGNQPFKEYCDANNEDVVLAGTGGLLTMLSMPQGIGSGSSEQHADAFTSIAKADARKINQIFQSDFDCHELAAEFPGQPHLAYFELCSVEEEDATAFCQNVAMLKQAGYTTKPEQIEEKTGIELMDGDELPEKPETETEEDLQTKTPAFTKVTNRADGYLNEDIAITLRETLRPVLERLDAISKVEDAAIQKTMLEKLLKDFPQISEAIAADESLAKVLAPAMQDALLAGLKGNQP